ncbi:MAG: hypothetical protein AUJ76_02815 [Candidatus Omnitrophica bacterium CG1_02_41_171]|nr:MAG: hypothetical protein AUJ76_02815 [Candidatus Omnitrophica bacterium CG1_02_41_171]
MLKVASVKGNSEFNGGRNASFLGKSSEGSEKSKIGKKRLNLYSGNKIVFHPHRNPACLPVGKE